MAKSCHDISFVLPYNNNILHPSKISAQNMKFLVISLFTLIFQHSKVKTIVYALVVAIRYTHYSLSLYIINHYINALI